jgi:hypothetical protein
MHPSLIAAACIQDVSIIGVCATTIDTWILDDA